MNIKLLLFNPISKNLYHSSIMTYVVTLSKKQGRKLHKYEEREYKREIERERKRESESV